MKTVSFTVAIPNGKIITMNRDGGNFGIGSRYNHNQGIDREALVRQKLNQLYPNLTLDREQYSGVKNYPSRTGYIKQKYLGIKNGKKLFRFTVRVKSRKKGFNWNTRG